MTLAHKLLLAAFPFVLTAPCALSRPSPPLPSVVAPMVAQSAGERAMLGEYNLAKKNRLAISGYDPVSYFPEGGAKPKKGSKKIEFVHAGVRYRFANTQNKAAFERTPERFEPAYGGWCAYAMAKNDKVGIDPKSYLIQEGRLLLFYDGFLADTRKRWKKQGPEKLMPRADAAWKKISGEAPSRELAHFHLEAGLAVDGYDPVSYFAEGGSKPALGDRSRALLHQGVTYFFSSDGNRKAFQSNPSRFEPLYGGWCAWAMAQGKKVAVDPRAYALSGGKLYLFYNQAKRDEWKTDSAGFVRRAGEEWTGLHR